MITSRFNLKLAYILLFLTCFAVLVIFYENKLTQLGDKLLELGKYVNLFIGYFNLKIW